MPSRIGDLVVLGDRETVFGNLETAVEALPPGYKVKPWSPPEKITAKMLRRSGIAHSEGQQDALF